MMTCSKPRAAASRPKTRPARKPLGPKTMNLIALGVFTLGFALMIMPYGALAQSVNVDLGQGGTLSARVVQLIGLMTVLSLAPSIVIMTTSFIRIVVVLSLLRTALGMQQSPPNAVLVSLALFLSAIVMAPTWQDAYDSGIRPLLDQQMELPQAFDAASEPVKTFMLGQVDRDGFRTLPMSQQLES
jgi:flagellar biosynthetic protein FliP